MPNLVWLFNYWSYVEYVNVSKVLLLGHWKSLVYGVVWNWLSAPDFVYWHPMWVCCLLSFPVVYLVDNFHNLTFNLNLADKLVFFWEIKKSLNWFSSSWAAFYYKRYAYSGTHTHTQIHAHTRTQKHSMALTHTHTHAQSTPQHWHACMDIYRQYQTWRTHTKAYTLIKAQIHTQTFTHKDTHTHQSTHTHTHICTHKSTHITLTQSKTIATVWWCIDSSLADLESHCNLV